MDTDIIEDCIGGIGRWQILMVTLISLLRLSVSWHQLSIVFLAPISKFTCSNTSIDACSSECPSHIFEKTDTIIEQWDLVCENGIYVSVSQFVFMFGQLVGSTFFGFLCDKYGRKMPLIFADILALITGVGAAFVPWFWLFMILKFLSNVALGGLTLFSFVLSMELVGKSYRATAGALFHLPFFIGYSILGLLGYLIRDWQYLQFTISIWSILYISYYWIIPESPRWLLIVGRTDEVITLLQKAAKLNHLPTFSIKEKVMRHVESKQPSTNNDVGNILDLFRTKEMRFRTCFLLIIYFCILFVYYGISQYMGQIGDTYINIGISGAVQVPGAFLCIFTMDKIGRKRTFIIGNILSTICCLLIIIVPEDASWGLTVLGCLGIFFIGISVNANYILSSELFPTVVRSVGMGVCAVTGKIGTAVCPFVINLSGTIPWLPPLVLGVMSFIPCLFYWKLPETFNQKLPDTIEEIEQMGQSRKNSKIITVMNS